MSHLQTSILRRHPLPNNTFKSYLIVLIVVGSTILVSSYIQLRPYLSSLSINYLSSSNQSIQLSILPTITAITPSSASFSWSTTPPDLTHLDYGMTEQTISTKIALPKTSTYTLDNLAPGKRYFFRLSNAEYSFISPTYSFITKQK